MTYTIRQIRGSELWAIFNRANDTFCLRFFGHSNRFATRAEARVFARALRRDPAIAAAYLTQTARTV